MTIETQLTEADFIKVNFVILYKKLSAKLITGIAIFVLIVSLMGIITAPQTTSWTEMVIPIGMIAWLPILTYFASKRNYNLNKRISEQIEYHISPEYLSLKGDSFTSEYTWDKIYKVTKTNDWILIWQTKQIANVIPRKSIVDMEIPHKESIFFRSKLTTLS